jgi:hypothetical protein
MLEKIQAKSNPAPSPPPPASPPSIQPSLDFEGQLPSQSISDPPAFGTPPTPSADTFSPQSAAASPALEGDSPAASPSATDSAASGEDESWRTSLSTNPAASAGAASLVQEPAPPVDRNILDLFDAWAAALILKVHGTYEEEVSQANVGHTLLSLIFAALISGVVAFLSINLILVPMGGIEGLILEIERLSGTPIDAATFAVLSSWFSTAGIIIPIIAAIGMVIGRLFYGIMMHVAARVLGGEGELLQTVSAVSIASVALAVLNLIPTIAGIGGVFAGFGAQSLLNVYQGVGLIAWVARLAIDGAAITAAHRNFGIFKGIISVVLSGVLLGVVSCCLIFAMAMLGGGQ